MRVRLTPRALADAKRMDAWWRQNRSKAEDLFTEELERTLAIIATTPNLGKIYEQANVDVEVRRIFMAKTRNHIYYAVTTTEIVVLTVWGATKGQGPKV